MTFRYITPGALLEKRFSAIEPPKWDAAVICFRDHKGSQLLVHELGAKPVGTKVLYGLDESYESPFVYQARIGECSVAVITRCVWGGPQAAILVEELACLGIKYLIGFGAAGGIDPSIPRGAQIVVGNALPTDGTTRMYVENGVSLQADSSLLALALESGRTLPCDIQTVTAATIDALYRETDCLISGLRSMGAQIVNMETSPFYASAAACGVKAIWLGHVSDCLTSDKWDGWHANRGDMSMLTSMICHRLIAMLAKTIRL